MTANGGPAPAERVVFVQGGAGELRVSDGGRGAPAVVLLHGLGSELEVWRSALDHLRRTRRAVAYDQRGHGGSGRARDAVYTIEALAGDLEAVVSTLGLRRFVLVGHSLSGTVLTRCAGSHPDRVAGLVYVDAIGDFHMVAREQLDEAARKDERFEHVPEGRLATYGDVLGKHARRDTRVRVIDALKRLDPPAYARLRRDMFDFVVGSRLAAFRGPIVAIEAEDSDLPFMASRVVPRARRSTVGGVSHWLMLDDPEAFELALDEALAGL